MKLTITFFQLYTLTYLLPFLLRIFLDTFLNIFLFQLGGIWTSSCQTWARCPNLTWSLTPIPPRRNPPRTTSPTRAKGSRTLTSRARSRRPLRPWTGKQLLVLTPWSHPGPERQVLFMQFQVQEWLTPWPGAVLPENLRIADVIDHSEECHLRVSRSVY